MHRQKRTRGGRDLTGAEEDAVVQFAIAGGILSTNHFRLLSPNVAVAV